MPKPAERDLGKQITRRQLLAGIGTVVTVGLAAFAPKPEGTPVATAQVGPAKPEFPGEDGVKARILKPGEAAERLADPKIAQQIITSEFKVGNIVLKDIPAFVNEPQVGPDIYGMPGSGEFFVPHGPHYKMGTEADVIKRPSQGRVDLILGRQHQFGEVGEPGFTGLIEVSIPGNTMVMRSWAEAGEVAKFAYGEQRREMHWAIEQWHKIQNTGGQVGNWVNVREVDFYDGDPGDAFLRLRRGHNRLYIAEMLAPQFPYTQFVGFDQIQPANFVNYALMHRARDGKTWVAEAEIGPYPGPGQRRNLNPESHRYRHLYDNFTGIPRSETIVKPIDPIRL